MRRACHLSLTFIRYGTLSPLSCRVAISSQMPWWQHLERLAPWLEHLLRDKPIGHARLVRPFAHWSVFRRARRAAARGTYGRGSADFARARVLAALDLLSWLDHRNQSLDALTRQISMSGSPRARRAAGPCAISSSGQALAT
jgi:hypothetical protein